jgi:hypothetical protein
MEQQSRWRRWFGGKAPPPSEEVDLAALRQAYLSQRRRWDYAVAFCALLIVVTAILRPWVALLPAAATVFIILEYRKCNRMAQMMREAEALQRWAARLQAEAEEEEKRRREE